MSTGAPRGLNGAQLAQIGYTGIAKLYGDGSMSSTPRHGWFTARKWHSEQIRAKDCWMGWRVKFTAILYLGVNAMLSFSLENLIGTHYCHYIPPIPHDIPSPIIFLWYPYQNNAGLGPTRPDVLPARVQQCLWANMYSGSAGDREIVRDFQVTMAVVREVGSWLALLEPIWVCIYGVTNDILTYFFMKKLPFRNTDT